MANSLSEPTQPEPIDNETQEDIAIRNMLEEGESLIGVADDGLINWYLHKSATDTYEEALIKQQCDKVIRMIKRRRAAREYKFKNQIHEATKIAIEKKRDGVKTVHHPWGSIQLRLSAETIEVHDQHAFKEWVDDQPMDIRAELQECFDLVFKRKSPLKKYMEETGESDIPGVTVIPAQERMTVKTKIIERG